ncbi:hypothetical protein RM530_03500 [Algiphilus sp. W345]|uniref:MFS transporter n=1 Tax=Banduia mediterranea TaxID=3075609 RepID=A0ABU2WEY0_9GAMM|nr:hypothetical protein [Algiphilus sp. W345]MDT0496431.1 hypothetical protein [Algiphilus sp. W345]
MPTVLLLPADPRAPSTAGGEGWRSVGALLKLPRKLPLLALIFCGNGCFNSIFTWLKPILGGAGIDAPQAAWAGRAILFGGLASLAVVSIKPPPVERIRTLLVAATSCAIPLIRSGL